ncbi:hypothetical protein [Prevotella sp. 10(H)]|uniref:hypothetical protein n=1 Tax=Prevotella sp. 10(H) TaxID=1158294 RepID=UPI0004A74E4E|nr:hypothetical protein [Prevotella sp. 10(H)]
MTKTRQQWIDEMAGIEKRWFVFLDRLEERVKEFVEASIPELQEAYKNDTDAAKRTYGRLADSIEGQIESVRKKAEKVYEKEIEDYYHHYLFEYFNSSDEDELQGLEDIASDTYFEVCDPRYKKFEKIMDDWSKKVKDTEGENTESKYQAIIDEYEQLKDKFACKQCGSPISIPHIFLTTAYVECTACQTQNTFEPSSRARELDFVGRELAEQRNEYLKKEYDDEKDRLDEIHDKISDLESDMMGLDEEDDAKEYAKLQEKMKALKAEYKATKENIPVLYKKYLKATFDEWIRLVPQLAEQNQRVYEGWLADYERRGE